jgi:hypothetical protein
MGFEVSAEIYVDDDEIREHGWHRKGECDDREYVSGDLPSFEDSRTALMEHVITLHRQAHPDSTLGYSRCRERVCEDLTSILGGRGLYA